MQTTNSSHLRIAALLASTLAMAPFALDTYLPAFPEIAHALGTTVHDISYSIGIYVFCFALGQLIGGPLADQYGRAIVMTTGVAIFACASMIMSGITEFWHLMATRVLQAFGGGFATVCVAAIVRDRFSGREAAKFFSTIGLIMVIAPAIAPSLGSLFLALFGWRSIFIFLSLYALLLIPSLLFGLFDGSIKINRKKTDGTTNNESYLNKYLAVLKRKKAIPFLLVQICVTSVLLSFLSHASFMYLEHFAVDTVLFSILMAANVGLIVIMNLSNRVALRKYSSDTILRWALVMQCTGTIALLLVVLFAPNLVYFAAAMILTIGSLGAIGPNSQACFMEFFSELSGTAAALFGASQFALAGLITSLATMVLPETLTSIVLVQAICSLLALTIAWRFAKMPSSG